MNAEGRKESTTDGRYVRVGLATCRLVLSAFTISAAMALAFLTVHAAAGRVTNMVERFVEIEDRAVPDPATADGYAGAATSPVQRPVSREASSPPPPINEL